MKIAAGHGFTDDVARRVLQHAYSAAFCDPPRWRHDIRRGLKQRRYDIAFYAALSTLIPGFHLIVLRRARAELVYAGCREIYENATGHHIWDPASATAVMTRVISAGFRTQPPRVEPPHSWNKIQPRVPLMDFPDELLEWIREIVVGVRRRKLVLGFVPVIGPLVAAATDLTSFDRMTREIASIIRERASG